VEKLLKKGKQRLGAIDVNKRASPRDHRCKNG